MNGTKRHGWLRRLTGGSMVVAVAGLLMFEGLAAQELDDQVTFTRDIAPLIQENCQTCHREGGFGPMPLITYEDARLFAPLIKFKVHSRQMPPWPIDKTVGIQDFKNDWSLTNEEIATIERWVDSGAPEGDPRDMPPAIEWPDFTDTWRFEEVFGRPPDVIVESPIYRVKPNGQDQWPNLVATWEGVATRRLARAIEARPKTPETRYVFHHGGPTLIGENGERTGLMNSPSGKVGEIWPDDAGKVLYPGTQVNFGMHFFPIGDEVEASVQWGLWLYPEGEEPEFETGEIQFRADQTTGSGGFPGHNQQLARRADLIIPPNGQAMHTGTYVLDQPARIHSLRGHMHSRGKYQMVEAVYPDGRHELLNKLNWDHGWHLAFMYEEDVMPLLPKGTVLIMTSIWDNTANNRYNHDPDQWVFAGSRTIDEMSHIWIGITYFGGHEEYFQGLLDERERVLTQQQIAIAAENDGADR